jgi:hypothetical protein
MSRLDDRKGAVELDHLTIDRNITRPSRAYLLAPRLDGELEIPVLESSELRVSFRFVLFARRDVEDSLLPSDEWRPSGLPARLANHRRKL